MQPSCSTTEWRYSPNLNAGKDTSIRTSKVFKQMSAFIATRSPTQCRSQNQKMLKRCGTSSRVVNRLRSELGVEYFEGRYRELVNYPLINFVRDAGHAQEKIPEVKEEEQERVRPQREEK